MCRLSFGAFALFALVLIAFGAQPPVAHGQLPTQHVKGSVGLKSGSQPPPGGYIPLIFYRYMTDEVRDRNGGTLPGDADLTSVFYGVGYSQVFSRKILGGFYGFSVLFPAGANNRIQGTEIDQNPGAGLTDSVFTPITLGWHHTRADFLAGFNIYAPTGRYTNGANDNTGLGMWGFEPAFGTTVCISTPRSATTRPHRLRSTCRRTRKTATHACRQSDQLRGRRRR